MPERQIRRAPRVSVRPGEPRRSVLRGLRVLWIDDQPYSNVGLVEYLRSCGVHLEQVTGLAEAASMFRDPRPDAVLSDLGRGFDDDRGVVDLSLLRKDDTYVGPVLFVSGRLPDLELQERVRGLGADGPTNNEEDVVRWLERVAKG